MSHRLVALQTARCELLEAVAWYDKQAVSAGDRLLAEVNAGPEKIALDPERFNFSKLGARRYRLPVFPYDIHFQLRGKLIGVFAIYHRKRDVRPLRRRL